MGSLWNIYLPGPPEAPNPPNRRGHRQDRRNTVPGPKGTEMRRGFCLGLVFANAVAATAEVWVVSPMVKVRLDTLPPAKIVRVVDWAGMRGELEHSQVCLRPRQSFAGVHAAFSPLNGPAGTIPADTLQWRRVGYVNCKKTTAYKSDPGWWPDPLMPADRFVLHPDETQPVWLTVRIPRAARPGPYSGTVRIMAGKKNLATVPIKLEVWDIALPFRGTFQTAFTFTYKPTKEVKWFVDLGRYYGGVLPEKIKWRYFDLLASRRLYADNIYLPGPRPLEDYLHLAENGANCFNLMEISNADGKGRRREYSDAYVKMMLAKLDPVVRELRERGLLRYAYVYGFDECTREFLPGIRQLYSAVKQRFPDLRTMLLVNWAPPTDIGVDIWCHIYHVQNPTAAAAWRAAGKQVWWYHCVGPRAPYMNTFVEWPGIQARLLFWLAAKHDVPGWLYYCMDHWFKKDQKKIIEYIGDGPRTDFDPATYRDVNGDGSFLYPGKDGPVSTVRLENLCDGIEDLELFAQLRTESSRLARKVAGIENADIGKSLITRLLRNATDRTEDPALLEATRRKAAHLLVDMREGRRPGVWVLEPDPDAWIFGDPTAQVKGIVGNAATAVTVNGHTARLRGSRFSVGVPLRPGTNTLVTTVAFADGHCNTDERTVRYRKRFLPPSTKDLRLVSGKQIDNMDDPKRWRVYDDKPESMTLERETTRKKEGEAALRFVIHPDKQKSYRVCVGRHIPLMGDNLGVRFWLYAEKPGGTLGVELCEQIAWSNWTLSLNIDWQGWKLIELPWERFRDGGNHMSSGNGVPDWDKIFWIAFNGYKGKCPTAPMIVDDLRWLRAE